jgi:Na+/proline symporter
MQPAGTDAEQLTRQLDLELSMKRVQWKQAKAKKKNLRNASILFIFLLIAGCVFAAIFFMSDLQERRRSMPSSSAQTDPVKGPNNTINGKP